MKLLLTNDDSIESVFLHELAHALRNAGHQIYVVAPKTEQSWIGAAKSRHRPVSSKPEDRGLGCPTWIVDGTPSDCVNIGIAHLLPERPDAVVSGVNLGFNASIGFMLASGTIAGAFEGAVHGLPAVALSQDLPLEEFESVRKNKGKSSPQVMATLRMSCVHAAKLIPKFAHATASQSFIVHNVNFPYPCTTGTDVRRTVPARVIIPGLFSPQADDGTHRFVFQLGQDVSPDKPLTDRAALANGYISHTILDYTKLGT
ncbi:MAG: 5'/3'-nucleotidase SurE [Nibricoccus sp.]